MSCLKDVLSRTPLIERRDEAGPVLARNLLQQIGLRREVVVRRVEDLTPTDWPRSLKLSEALPPLPHGLGGVPDAARPASCP